MRYDEFIKEVEERTGAADRQEAERAAVAVVQALSERLAGGEPEDLLSQLPKELKERVRPIPKSNPMEPDEFVERVAHELEVSPEEGREAVRGVFQVLREAVTPGEFDDVMSQLDPEYAQLVG
jgi:uncharacterized protein (DUF2267 family)